MIKNIQLPRPDCNLFGTVLWPEDKLPKAFAILHAGSGPTDRDGNNHLGLNTNCLKQLAEALANMGIASLRYDKRAIDSSRAHKFNVSELTITDYIDDLKAWIYFAKKQFGLSPFLIGHSEGALICAAASVNNIQVRGLVSVCGTSQNAKDLILEQLLKLAPELHEAASDLVSSIVNKTGLMNVPPGLQNIFRSDVLLYLESWFDLYPCDIMSKLKMPVLVIGSNTDRQVRLEDCRELSKALMGSVFVEIQNMSHTLKATDGFDVKLNEEYTNPAIPISEDLVDCIGEFINGSYHEL